jgi:two-component system nitrogen regulation sensor histidine kinase NtrY
VEAAGAVSRSPDMAITTNVTHRHFLERLLGFAQSPRLFGRVALVLAVLALASGTATYLVLTPGQNTPSITPWLARTLLIFDLMLLLALAALVGWRLVRLFVERRRGAAGSKLHARIVALFSAVAITPAIIMAAFSALFFQFGLESWFSDRVNTAVRESVAVAEAYIQEHIKLARADVLAIALDLNRDAARLTRNPALFNQVLTAQTRLRNLSEAVVFDSSGRVLARSALSFSFDFERLSRDALEQADRGEIFLIASEPDDRVRALIKLDGFLDTYLYVGRFVDARVLDHLLRTRQAARQYAQLEQTRSSIELTVAVIFIVVSLLVLLAAIWFGLAIATRLVRPVGSLIAAAERVREGDFSARADESRSDDEMALLGRAFNRMTGQLAAQRHELVDANRSLDDRRRFTETVLAGVSAGVIAVGQEGTITLCNPSAVALLETPLDRLVGRSFAEALPELDALLRAAAGTERNAQGQVTVARGGRARNLAVRVSRETGGAETAGYVVTFDDITDLVSAQRTAAWADVARRIAHEIKNPLTPIQLSAERLKRKYLKEIVSDSDVFVKCTDTIIRQVGDIGRMVDEFSAFARMPAPTFRSENMVELVRQAVFLQQVANTDIAYAINAPDVPVDVRCDGRQMAQVLTNLLQNAADAIQGRQAGEGDMLPPGRIQVTIGREADGRTVVAVTDNGRGLPQKDRERLTEPYVTTRAKGTGLGLAIVKKIMEEHGGSLVLSDAASDGEPDLTSPGATITLTFPPVADAAVPAARQRIA